MLISSLKAKKNIRLVHWPGHQRFKPRYPQSSRDGSQFHEAVLIKSPPCGRGGGGGTRSLPWSASLKWPDRLPVDPSSVRKWLALFCTDFMQFNHVLWYVWRDESCHTGGFLCFKKFLGFFFFYSARCSSRGLISCQGFKKWHHVWIHSTLM